MRKYIRLLLLLLLFAAIFPFTFPWKNGKPILDWRELKMPETTTVELPELTLPQGEETTRPAHQPVTLYRWKDSDGVIQFGNEPPGGGIAFETVEVNPDANLLQAPTAAPQGQESGAEAPSASPSLPSPLTVSPEEALQIFEDAKEIREMSEERLRQHEAIGQ